VPVPAPVRPRSFSERGLTVEAATLSFLAFIQTTAVNELAGLRDDEARRTPLETSPVMSLLRLTSGTNLTQTPQADRLSIP
jgi:hypothetical protein